MQAGSDARKGIYPHRDATSAWVIAREREYHEIVTAIEEAENLYEPTALPGAKPLVLRQPGRDVGPLPRGVIDGDIGVVRSLLDRGVDVDERILLQELEEPTPSWGMPLWHAALNNQYEIAELLLDRRADPNASVYASGWPLMNPWSHPDGKLKNLLLACGAKRQP